MIGCAVALVLLMDVSSSVTEARFALEREGSARALSHPEVAGAITPEAPVALAVIDWGREVATVLPWRVLRGPDDAARAGRDLAATPRMGFGKTAIGGAIRAGLEALASAPCEPDRRVLDVSGDGANNQGEDPDGPRDDAAADGVTVNGLPIVTAEEPGLLGYYREHVVTPSGFAVPAHGFEDVEAAMARKLEQEISGVPWDGRGRAFAAD